MPVAAVSARCRYRLRRLAALSLATALAMAVPPCAAQPGGPPERAPEPVEGRQIAVLPLLNRTGGPAPMAEIREELAAALADRGFSLLDEGELERFMRRHRLRYTGGVNREIARVLRSETGAAAALVTSLDLYQDSEPPKIGLTSRLVSAGDVADILWMDARAQSGDEAPGLLGLGLVAEQAVVRRRVIAWLADSLAAAAQRAVRGEATQASWKSAAKRFRPKIAYATPDGRLRQAVSGRIVVLPLANESTTRYAGEIVTDQLVRHLAAIGAGVVEPGVVRHALLEARQIQPQGPSVPQMDVLRAALNADLVLYGEVAHYQDAGAGTPEPRLGLSLRAVDTATRQVVWASVSHTRGNEGVFFFDVGRIATAHRLSSELARAVVVALGRAEGEVGPAALAALPRGELRRVGLLAIGAVGAGTTPGAAVPASRGSAEQPHAGEATRSSAEPALAAAPTPAAETDAASAPGEVEEISLALRPSAAEAEVLEETPASPEAAVEVLERAPPAAAQSGPEADLAAAEAAVRAWAAAWGGQRTSDYLARYSSAFRPPTGMTREAWEEQRRERLSRPRFIDVTVESLQVELVEPGLARASFRQTYRSNLYADVVTKTLDLAREPGGWAIVRERAQ